MKSRNILFPAFVRACFLIAGLGFLVGLSAAPLPSESVKVRKSVVTLRRDGKGPGAVGDKAAEVNFPVVSGLRNAAVMAKVRKAVSLKAVFGQSVEEFRAEFQTRPTLDGIKFEVNHNRDGILCLTFMHCGTVAHSLCYNSFVTVDLKTGDPVTANRAFVNPSGLAALIDAALQAEIRQTLADARRDVQTAPEVRDILERELGADDPKMKRAYDVAFLDRFIVDDKGVTFFFEYGFLAPGKPFEPAGRFFLDWKTVKPFVKPGGPFARFVR